MPIIAIRVQGQLEHAMALVAAHFAIGDKGDKWHQRCAARAYGKLANPCGISHTVCVLQRKSFVDMVVPVEDNFGTRFIEQVPEI